MRVFGYKLSHILSPKRWRMVLGYWISKKLNFIPVSAKNSIVFSEIVQYRANRCPQCTAAGKCIGTGEEGSGCGCEVNGLFSTLDSECDLGAWPSLRLNNYVKEWQDFKKLEELDNKVKSLHKI